MRRDDQIIALSAYLAYHAQQSPDALLTSPLVIRQHRIDERLILQDGRVRGEGQQVDTSGRKMLTDGLDEG